jgi:hypothetical protein
LGAGGRYHSSDASALCGSKLNFGESLPPVKFAELLLLGVL